MENLTNGTKSIPCVRCGSCKALCPTYELDPVEGMSARGRIILLKRFLQNEIGPSDLLYKRIFSCILCGACNRLCPLGIDITNAVYRGRINLKGINKKWKIISFILMQGFKRPSTAFSVLRVLASINKLLPDIKIQPFVTLRNLDIAIPDSTLRDEMYILKSLKPRGRIAIFAGCTVNFLYPYIGRALISFLHRLQYDVILPKAEVCCGAPLMGLGFEEEAKELAKRNIDAFKKMKVSAIIGTCPTCIHFVKNEYKMLVGEQLDKAMELSQFIVNESGSQFFLNDTKKVVYHDPCHSVYGLNVKAQPREILRSMGFDILNSESGCCGFGGTFRLLYHEMSEDILKKRAQEYKKAEMVITSCPNCILQLKSEIKDIPVKHLIEIINESAGDKK